MAAGRRPDSRKGRGRQMFRRNAACFSLIFLLIRLAAAGPEAVPGVVINHIPSSSGVYIGSPGIAVLPNGDYLAKHDEFGPRSTEGGVAITQVFRSADRGRTWSHRATVKSMYWASIFVLAPDVYLMGTSKNHGYAVISRSVDGGRTWTAARDRSSGLLLDDAKYHCAPVPVVVHRGRIWRGMEDAMGPGGWGTHFWAFVMSAPADANLLDADNWVSSHRIGRDPQWLGGKFGGWLEGNAVVTPEGEIVDILRVDYRPEGGKAAVIRISKDGRQAAFDPETDFIDFPGGAKKFTIRYDPVSKAYWTLSNAVLPRHKDPDPSRVRNAVALMRSSDLRRWEIRCIVLYHPDVNRHGFQYLDWLFDGEDIIAASRTAYGQGADAAPRQHDANYLTFHRFKNFRTLTMKDSATGAGPGDEAWSGEKMP
jgi:hypothetical protein